MQWFYSTIPSRCSGMRALALWALCARALSAAASLLPPEAEQLRASVGGFAVMNCHLDFPFGNEIPYHLQWDKDVSCFPFLLRPYYLAYALWRSGASLQLCPYLEYSRVWYLLRITKYHMSEHLSPPHVEVWRIAVTTTYSHKGLLIIVDS